MNWIWQTIWFFLKRYVKGQAISQARRQGVIAYLHALQGTRHFLIAMLLGFFAFHFIVLAGVGALVTGLLLFDIELHTILVLLFCIFSAMFFIPVGFLCLAFSERAWYKFSGAEKMVEDLKKEAA